MSCKNKGLLNRKIGTLRKLYKAETNPHKKSVLFTTIMSRRDNICENECGVICARNERKVVKST